MLVVEEDGAVLVLEEDGLVLVVEEVHVGLEGASPATSPTKIQYISGHRLARGGHFTSYLEPQSEGYFTDKPHALETDGRTSGSTCENNTIFWLLTNR